MGIKNLLPYFKNVQEEKNIKEYSGQTVGIDTYVWLHAAITNCSMELAKGEFSFF